MGILGLTPTTENTTTRARRMAWRHNPTRQSSKLNISTMSETITEEEEYWFDDKWVPTMPSGKQCSPDMIRREFQKYIDNSDETQASILKRIGVTASSYYTFMNPSKYKNAWSAVSNSAYWGAARLLEEERYRRKKFGSKKKTVSNKRKAFYVTDPQSDTKKPRASAKYDMEQLLLGVASVQCDATPKKVYDSCPELVKKIKDFLKRDGATKASLCAAAGTRLVPLNKFLLSKNQDSCAAVIYPRLWMFFERLRIYENQPKSAARLKNEKDQPNGFKLNKIPWIRDENRIMSRILGEK